MRARVRPPAWCNGRAGGGATHDSPELPGDARWGVASTPETTGGSTRCHAAPVLEHLVGGAGDPAGPASGPALPPSCSLTEKDERNPTHNHTACRQGEGDTFCDATAANSCCCGSRLESAGSPAHNGTPALSPEEEPWRAGGGATHAPRTTDRADRRQAHIPPRASVGGALGCAALDTSGSGPPGGSADGLAVLAGAAVPSPAPAPSHRLSRSLPNQPIAPASLCDAISGVMPGPDGQGCCFCPSDITPARDGPAHAYPDDAVDGAARANRTSQYNAPIRSGVMKPVCRLTDRLPDQPPSDLGREPQEP